MIAPAITPTQMALHEARKARQARQAQMAATVTANDNPRVVVIVKPQVPLWKTSVINFDAHVNQFYMHRANAAGRWHAFIVNRARDFGITAEQAMTPFKLSRKDAIKKQIILYELLQMEDPPSIAQAARMFGYRDHSPAHYVLKKIGKMKAEGLL